MRKGIGITYHHTRLVPVMQLHVKSNYDSTYMATTRLVQNTIVPVRIVSTAPL